LYNIYKKRSLIQVSVLNENVKRKLDTGYVTFHVHIMYSPNCGIYFDTVEDDSAPNVGLVSVVSVSLVHFN